jgi:Cu(I)/Ag(I) efflux system membrane fusion protein
LEALKLQEVNPNLVEAARNKLRFWKIGKDVIDAIEQNETIKETFTLFADESGIVAKRKVSVGDYVRQGEPLFDLMNLNKVWVLFDAYEEDLANIKMGERIEFTTPAIPNKTFKTRITFIDPIINPKTRVASLRTEVSNTNGLLKPEMLVYGTLQEKAISKTQLTVPKSAVLWTGKRSVVYVKVPDMEVPSFKYKEIEIGESLGDSYQVISGLEAGEEVVTYGSFTIDAAAQLNNQVSMMNKNVNMKKDETGVPNFQPETPDEFKSQLNALANAYIQLKDAFVATDAATASTAAEKVVAQIEKIDMSLLKGDAHIYWMEQLNALQAHSKKITELEEVEEQRKQFGFLSDALINSIEAFGTAGKALYVQHCPMAFDNQGGDWLALEEQIQNPYFGDKMMKCGLVKKELTERTEVMNSTPNKPMQGHNH